MDPAERGLAEVPSPLDDALAAFAEAVRCAGRCDRRLGIAGRTIEFRFAGAALERMLWPAFAHLAGEASDSPDLVVACWDDATAGVASGGPLRPAEDRAGLDFVDGPIRIAWEPARRVFSAYERSRRLGLLGFPSAESIAAWERSAPARRVLHWWASDRGLQLVHAAAVGTTAGGVLLVGRGGSGKSTTALACLGTNLGYAADDYCLVSLDDPPRVHALYGTGKADEGSIGRLPRLRESFARSTLGIAGKTVIDIAREFPSAMIASFPLRAVVVPRVGASSPRLVPIPPVAALRALAPSTMMQLPGDRRDTLGRLASIVGAVPCFELALADDPATAVPLLAGLAREGAAS